MKYYSLAGAKGAKKNIIDYINKWIDCNIIVTDKTFLKLLKLI